VDKEVYIRPHAVFILYMILESLQLK